MGSASDLECEIILAFDLGFIERAEYEELTASVTRLKRMIAGLLRSVRRRPKPNRQPTTENREPRTDRRKPDSVR